MATELQVQHPIPQEISSYQFRLVGDMTLKQFFQVAAGALIALLIYSSNLAAFIKWPLMLIFFLIGIALAFFPLEDRPLEKWIILFFKSIYAPTKFAWVKTKNPTSYFASEEQMQATLAAQQSSKPQQQTVIEASQTPLPEEQEAPNAPIGIQAEASDAIVILDSSEQEYLDKISKSLDAKAPATALDTPENTPTHIEKSVPQEDQPTKPQNIVVSDSDVASVTKSVIATTTQQTAKAKQAIFSSDAAPPVVPTQPNIIVGQVMDAQGKIIDSAILEIRDADGRPARALKSNKLGHFGIVTPLANGNYKIITEKEGFLFDPLLIDVKGEITEPIAIKASGQVPSN